MTKGKSLFIAVITLIGLVSYQYIDVLRGKFSQNFALIDSKFVIKALLTFLLFVVMQYAMRKFRSREVERKLNQGKDNQNAGKSEENED